MIMGGWNYVWAAYGASWIVLGGYALSLWIRQRALRRREKESA